MSTLLSIHSLSKHFGSQLLFENICFTISQGDRIGLFGPNGAGKSTLIKILQGEEDPDHGNISRKSGLRVGYASQSPEFDSISLEEALLEGVVPQDKDEYQIKARVLLGKALFIDFEQKASQLSGGWKKRLSIVKALMNDPDLLLLDEPTNHLDLEGILWLEDFLLREKISYLIVSHDRYFLEKVSNKIIELNKCYPEGLLISKGNMSSFLAYKEAFLKAQQQQQKGIASVLRKELDWLKRSPKARTTKSEARVQNAYRLMDEFADVKKRNTISKVDIDFAASERDTKNLITVKNLTKSLGSKELFKGIDLTLSPGTRLGIVGKNGTGKTTFLKILAGLIPQDIGSIKYADDLKLVYFDQHREQLPQNATLKEALSPNGDTVSYRGQAIHVHGWARKFLFEEERLGMAVKCLSGGERARIQIAKLMLEPADVLFLDEPTNDLDISTLEVIEESLQEFPGAVVLISHDRALMDKVCTKILALGGETKEYFFADYPQWERAVLQASSKKEISSKDKEEATFSNKEISKKLSYKEKKELEGMESFILTLENEIQSLHKKAAAAMQAGNSSESREAYSLLGEAQKKLELVFERWQELENKAKGL